MKEKKTEPATRFPNYQLVMILFVLIGIVGTFDTLPFGLRSGSNIGYQEKHKEYKKVALFLTFPNSGTSYTLRNVRDITGIESGTNYGFPSVQSGITQHGPFFGQKRGKNKQEVTSSQFLLTKTHCEGRCHMCPAWWAFRILDNPQEFRKSCFLAEDQEKKSHFYYPEFLMKRAVHIIRHPLDNAVARINFQFRTYHTDDRLYKDPFWHNPDTPQRDLVQAHCKLSDTMYGPRLLGRLKGRGEHAIAEALEEQMPLCGVEILKYVRWHENVLFFMDTFVMERHNKFPTHQFFYEDYSSNYNQTVTELLNFLNLPSKGWEFATPFVANKTYVTLFTEDEQQQTYRFIQQVASPELWELLNGRYNFFG